MFNFEKTNKYYERKRNINKGDILSSLLYSLSITDSIHRREEAISILKKYSLGIPYSELLNAVEKYYDDEGYLDLNDYVSIKKDINKLLKVHNRIKVLKDLGI